MENAEFHQQFTKSVQEWLQKDRIKITGGWLDSHVMEWGKLLAQPAVYVDAELPSRESIAVALAGISTILLERKSYSLKGLIEKTESPIERYMLLALFVCSHYVADDVFLLQSNDEFPEIINWGSLTLIIQPQVEIENYRVDFLITCSGGRYWDNEDPVKLEMDRIVVECDGHDFHERTKEQAKSDKERDRELQKLGYKVFRFTGSEIYSNPMKCAESVLAFLVGQISSRLISRKAG